MSRSLNKVTLIGNVGQDPDVRTTAGGTQVAKCSLATSRPYKDKSGEQQEKTQWHRLTFFGRLVDVVEQWINKGDRLYIEGRLEYSQTENEGTTRYWTDIIVHEMIMLGSKDRDQRGGGGTSTPAKRPAPSKPRKPITDPDDDLPF